MRLVAGPLLCALAVAVWMNTAAAQSYPSRPVRMIIPAGPSGGVDTIARLVGQTLTTALGQPVVMDNRPGAGTMLASEITAKSPPDGYTVLMATSSHAINGGIHKTLPYDPLNDFAAVALVATLSQVIVAHPSLPVKSVKDLIALARRRPGELLLASSGTGSGTHLAAELFMSMAHVRFTHVPYKSGSAAMVDLIGGHVQLMISNTINAMPHVKAGRLNAVAITSPARSRLYPQLPTVSESGLPGFQAEVWYGMLAPARTPADVIARLNRETVAILTTNDVRDKLAAQGADVVASTPAEFAEVIRRDLQKWSRVATSIHLQID